jgi:hypothetical protein
MFNSFNITSYCGGNMINEISLEESLNLKIDYSINFPLHEIVFNKYVEYIKSGQYPYLENVTDFILKEHPITNREALKTQVYMASCLYSEIKERELGEKMKSDGWQVLNIKSIEPFTGEKIKLFRRSDSILGNSEKEMICRVVRTPDDVALFPPRCSRKGYSVRHITQLGDKTQFFKPIKGTI